MTLEWTKEDTRSRGQLGNGNTDNAGRCGAFYSEKMGNNCRVLKEGGVLCLMLEMGPYVCMLS